MAYQFIKDFSGVFDKIKLAINTLTLKTSTMDLKLTGLPTGSELTTALNNKLPLEGNAKTASKLLTPVKIKLNGDVVGEVTTDFGSEATITTDVDFTTHTHSIKNLSDLSAFITNKNLNTRMVLTYDSTNHGYSLELQSQRIILQGDVAGYVDINGKDNIVYLNTEIADDSHTHALSNLTGYSELFNLFAPSIHSHTFTSANITDFDNRVADAITSQIQANNQNYYTIEGGRTVLKI